MNFFAASSCVIGCLTAACGKISFLSCSGDLVAGLDLVERNAAVDRLAHQGVMVRDAGGERVAERLLDVGAAQAGREHALLETVDDDLRLRPVAEPLVDRLDQLLGLAQPRHRRLADDEQLVGAEQHVVGPRNQVRGMSNTT